MIQILFLVIAALAILATLGVVLARNLVHAALHLVAFFFLVACLFLLLEAEFLAAIQVLVYIGAVSILLMFGIMLTRNVQGDDTTTARGVTLLPAGIIAVGLISVLCYGIADQEGLAGRQAWTSTPRRPAVTPESSSEAIARQAAINEMGRSVGNEMMSRYVLPFEVAGLLLTAALVGALALARHEGIHEPFMRTGPIAEVRSGSTTDLPLRSTGGLPVTNGKTSSEALVSNSPSGERA